MTSAATAHTPAELSRRYETVALVLQGGGALGAYQCGVYAALHDAQVQPTWFAGTSIGAINAAIMAGNAPEDRIAALRDFWTTICEPAGTLASATAQMIRESLAWLPQNAAVSTWANALGAMGALMHGQRGFFAPRPVSPLAYRDGSASATSFYDTAPLLATLNRLVDFERINHGQVRLTVGTTDVRNGNYRYFDSGLAPLRAEHILASGALPPAFAAVEIDGRAYWDGGIVSNTPLEYLLQSEKRCDLLALQVDLWSARGRLPRSIDDVLERLKDIQYSSRTRVATDNAARQQKLRVALTELLKLIPAQDVPADLQAQLQPWLSDKVVNIVHLIYQAKAYEEQYKDYAFGSLSMTEHWKAGENDMLRTLAHPAYFALPDRAVGIATHDVHRNASHDPFGRGDNASRQDS
ncbi:MAG: patatin-like phospholipase family protein [Tahibacter sp.]